MYYHKMAAAPYTHDGRVCIRDLMMSSNKVYRIAEKFGEDFNLAVWQIVKKSPN